VFHPTNCGSAVACDLQSNFSDGNINSSFASNPGFVGGGQYAFTQPLGLDGFNHATENFQPEDFNAALIPTPVGFSPLGFITESASGFQNYGAQDAWNQTATQNDATSSLSWGQYMNDASFNPTFQPLNDDGGFLENHLGVSMPWSPDTSMEGGFQHGIISDVTTPSTPSYDSNMPFDPTFSTTSMNESDLSPTASASAPSAAAPAPNPRQPNARISCTNPACTQTFKRHFERIRHEASVHRINRQRHLCPIDGCSKSHGRGYTRSDKVTEHLWKKHGNLGYMKA
jgi:hypothetical protein